MTVLSTRDRAAFQRLTNVSADLDRGLLVIRGVTFKYCVYVADAVVEVDMFDALAIACSISMRSSCIHDEYLILYHLVARRISTSQFYTSLQTCVCLNAGDSTPAHEGAARTISRIRIRHKFRICLRGASGSAK